VTFRFGHDGLRDIAAVLRQPLPPFFDWDFAVLAPRVPKPGRLCGCAITYARFVWPDFAAVAKAEPDVKRQQRAEARALNMRLVPYKAIFGLHIADIWCYAKTSAADITPSDVADAIDAYLAGTLVIEEF
jgi:hypothetical protein